MSKALLLLLCLFSAYIVASTSETSPSTEESEIEEATEDEDDEESLASVFAEEIDPETLPKEKAGAGPGFSRFKGDHLESKRIREDGTKIANCPPVTGKQRRAQKMFQSLIKAMRKRLTSQQPWKEWSVSIIKCSLGEELFDALSPAEQVKTNAETVDILKAELRQRQYEESGAALVEDPCNPFVVERTKMNTILGFRKTIMDNACRK